MQFTLCSLYVHILVHEVLVLSHFAFTFGAHVHWGLYTLHVCYCRCWTCNGFGRIECTVCHSKCQLKWYIKLTVTWKTQKVDHIVERTALPDHLIRAAEGKVAFQDQQPRVSMIIIYNSDLMCSFLVSN